MHRRLSALIVLPLVIGSSLAHSQSQSLTEPDFSQQQSQGQCPDGSAPVSVGGALPACNSTSPSSTNNGDLGQRSRPNSIANPAENGPLSNTNRTNEFRQDQSLPPEPLSEFQKFVAATTGQLLPIYGANLFRKVPTTFSPSDLSPAPSSYVLGPDDELRIRIWGQVNYSGNLRVDRSGDIYLPEAGAVHVAGLEFSALDQHLRSALARVYRNFDLSVDMGRIRSIQVYVTGQARRPGAYTVSSLSSLVDALFASGGPSAQGSLRHIELRRNGKTVTDFDLYALLIHGDKSKDERLLPEDVLFIPPAGPQVAITGSVHSPAIYEFFGKETVGDLIDFAGKTTAVVSSTRISLDRVGANQQREAMEFPFDTSGLAAPLTNGDIVHVYSIVPSYEKTVTLRGDVANPGRFAWHPGMHLSDLIPDRASLLSRDYWWKRSHLGLPSPEFEPFIDNIGQNTERRDFNRLSPNSLNQGNIRSQNDDNSYTSQTNTTTNQSTDPTSPAAQEALTNGLANVNRPEFDNGLYGANGINGTNGTTNQQNPDLNTGNGAIGGERARLGRNEKIRVEIPSSEIDWSYAVVEHLDAQTLKTSLEPFDLGRLVMNHDASQDLALEAGDTVTVFSQSDIRVPQEQQTKYVRLEGEFVHAGVYSVRKGETLRDLVLRAGGFTPRAYLYGSEFDRESTRLLQQERIDEYVRRVDLDAERGNLALTTAPSSSAGTLASATAAIAAEQQLILRLKQIRATGRIVLSFSPDTTGIDMVPELSLENGDRFNVPSAPSTINVVGAVYDQNSFLYQTGGSAGRYLQMAGGPDRNADYSRTFVIRADGSVISRDAVKGLWGNTFKTLKLNPGDTIVVPDKTIRPTALRGLLDWTQVFSQLALGAATINILR